MTEMTIIPLHWYPEYLARLRAEAVLALDRMYPYQREACFRFESPADRDLSVAELAREFWRGH